MIEMLQIGENYANNIIYVANALGRAFRKKLGEIS